MGQAAYVAAVLADTPQCFWQMQDASGLAVDSSGNGFDMQTVITPISYQLRGPFGSDFAIRGTFRRATTSLLADNFTSEIWYQTLGFAIDFQGIFANRELSPATKGWDYDVMASLKLEGVVQGVAFLAQSVNRFGPLVTSSDPWRLPLLGVGGSQRTYAWNHIVVKRQAGIWTYYFNGAVDTANAGGGAPVMPGAGLGYMLAGNDFGQIAYASYYPAALSTATVAAHYAAALS